MKRTIFLPALLSLAVAAQAQTAWKPVGGRIMTQWAANVNPAQPHAEYPRPQLVRGNWMNLNGTWQHAIQPVAAERPSSFAGPILVPFAVESALSGVGKTVGKDSVLWYERSFTLPKNYRKGKVLLHFGAVDWRAQVWVNGKEAGSHEGGYDPFSFDITGLLNAGADQRITVRVWDPTDGGPQPRGKQVKQPEGIWYTPVSGIWQTVWVESVPTSYITELRPTADIDRGVLNVTAMAEGAQSGDRIVITAFDGSTQVAEAEKAPGEAAELSIPNAKLWSPETPFLYDLRVRLVRGKKTVDEVKSYSAMRKISMQPDAQGIRRMLLNNKFVFQYGPLDQGWWPDGLYTAPTDEALRYDIEQTKNMGFNMIRKHVKVEPARWYYHCDRLGMLVWQDMPSGDLGNRWESRPGVHGIATDKDRTPESEQIYRKEWTEIMKDLYAFPSIVVWVPFNEAWGQFKTKDIVTWTINQDPSRLVNGASGGNFDFPGHIIDLHNYPSPAMPHPALFGKEHVLVLGEFGGLGLPLEGHTWQEKNNWGYQSFKSPEELFNRYSELIGRIPALINDGLSAAVYTQTTDVEVEVNGIMTYDRKVMKIPADKLKAVHAQLYQKNVAF
ncbi:MAG TPA: glycoside hydrolase family 2 TIM barrel-domain containing protein [Chitinophagaceae bacterium]|jgi:beta-galactosidase/beta-glucuronidase|nr:glycoside hydrolase family 2 TIM barrel-domain containing protein [Chitinophagaceae bacterium]